MLPQTVSAKRTLFDRVFRLPGPEPGPIVLNQRRVYILPTKTGLFYAAAVFVLLLASTNYDLSLGFALTFLLTSLGLVAMLQTFRNLAGLRISAGKVEPVFAGQAAQFGVLIGNAGKVPRFALAVGKVRGVSIDAEVEPGGSIYIEVPVPSEKRGWLELGKFSISTRYPMGLLHAWSRLELTVRCLIYPRPDQTHLKFPRESSDLHDGNAKSVGNDDFTGLRNYRAGDSPRRVAWKAWARGRGLLTKEFDGDGASQIWLDWNHLAGLDTEARLARLTRWALDANDAGVNFGLRLPGHTLAPGFGEQHLGTALESLALYGLNDATAPIAAR